MKITQDRIDKIRKELREMGENGIHGEVAWDLAEELLSAVVERDQHIVALEKGTATVPGV